MVNSVKITKFVAAFVCIVMAMLSVVSAIPACANVTTNSEVTRSGEIDIIFALDYSSSMIWADPNNLSTAAISKFVDAMSANIDVQYGAVTYYSKLNQPLSLGASASDVKKFANDVAGADKETRKSQTGTNAALGLIWATDELKTNGREKSEKVIIIIGDGEDSVESADSDRAAAIAAAQANGIVVYTLAVNTQENKDENFKVHFQNIADQTGGKCFEPESFSDLDTYVKEILSEVTGAMVTSVEVNLEPGTPHTEEIRVPSDVGQWIVQCTYEKGQDISVTLTAPSGREYNSSSPEYSANASQRYVQFTIANPEPGTWALRLYSATGGVVNIESTRYTNVSVSLADPSENGKVIEGTSFGVIIKSENVEITDENNLKNFNPKFVAVQLDENGNEIEGSEQYTDVKKFDAGRLTVTPKFKKLGDYKVYVEIYGTDDNSENVKVQSNELTITVVPDPNKLPLWAIILIVLGGVLLLVLVFLGINAMKNSPDYIKGSVAVKITAKTPMQESMIFQGNTFDCGQSLMKQNTLSDLMRVYINWYRAIGSGEWTEMTINQYLNSNLADVTDRIKLCGTKSGKTILSIPKGMGIEVDGMEVNSDKKITIASPEREMEIVINNNGYSYLVQLLFIR